MADEKNRFKEIPYTDFIFKYQFRRKISLVNYIFSRTPMLIIIAALIIAFNGEEIKYRDYFLLFLAFLFIYLYTKTKQTYASKLKLIYENKTADDDESVTLFSKISWAKKGSKRK